MAGQERTGPPEDVSIVGLLVAVAVFVDFIGIPVVLASESYVLATLFGGTVAGQAGLIAIWAVLGPRRWFVRLPAALAVAALLLALLGAGMAIETHLPWSDIGHAFLFLPMVFLAVPLPLWVRRFVGGWRIVRGDAEPELFASGSRQFNLQDLLGATVVLAIMLGLASVGLAEEGEMGETWIPLFLFCLGGAVWSAFCTLPCLWACFVARDKARSALAIAGCLVGITAILVVVVSAFAGRGPPAELVVAFFLFHAALVGVMLGVLHLLRANGYVLHRAGRKRSRTPLREGPSDDAPEEPVSPFEPHASK